MAWFLSEPAPMGVFAEVTGSPSRSTGFTSPLKVLEKVLIHISLTTYPHTPLLLPPFLTLILYLTAVLPAAILVPLSIGFSSYVHFVHEPIGQ